MRVNTSVTKSEYDDEVFVVDFFTSYITEEEILCLWGEAKSYPHANIACTVCSTKFKASVKLHCVGLGCSDCPSAAANFMEIYDEIINNNCNVSSE